MSVDPENLQLKPLDIHGVRTLVSWAADEGWNPGLYDADVFYATDNNGFYGYYYQSQLIAGGALVSYGDRFGFMGLFIVMPAYRSQGIGKRLWHQRRDLLKSRLKPGAAIGMDGVVAMQAFYNKGGFEAAFRGERHRRYGEVFPRRPSVVEILPGDFEAIQKYDTTCFGFPRPQFLRPWLFLKNSFGFKYVKNGALMGYASMRKVKEGYKICPLFADNAVVAESLYRACLSAVPNEPVFLDIPVVNVASMQMAKTYNTTYVFECGRMYLGKPPALPTNKIFGITTFELG